MSRRSSRVFALLGLAGALLGEPRLESQPRAAALQELGSQSTTAAPQDPSQLQLKIDAANEKLLAAERELLDLRQRGVETQEEIDTNQVKEREIKDRIHRLQNEIAQNKKHLEWFRWNLDVDFPRRRSRRQCPQVTATFAL